MVQDETIQKLTDEIRHLAVVTANHNILAEKMLKTQKEIHQTALKHRAEDEKYKQYVEMVAQRMGDIDPQNLKDLTEVVKHTMNREKEEREEWEKRIHPKGYNNKISKD